MQTIPFLTKPLTEELSAQHLASFRISERVREKAMQDTNLTKLPTTPDDVIHVMRERFVAILQHLFPHSWNTLLQYFEHINNPAGTVDLKNDAKSHVHYHTCLHVWSFTCLMADYMGFDPDVDNISDRTAYDRWVMRVYVLAIGMHDAHHSLGMLVDNLNIQKALHLYLPSLEFCGGDQAFDSVTHIMNSELWKDMFFPRFMVVWVNEEFIDPVNIGTVYLDFVSDLCDIPPGELTREKIGAELSKTCSACYDIVAKSEFPYNANVEPDSFAAVFRDLDRMSSATPIWYELIYQGLYSELVFSGKIEPNFVAFTEQQAKFVETMPFFSANVYNWAFKDGLIQLMKDRANNIAMHARTL